MTSELLIVFDALPLPCFPAVIFKNRFPWWLGASTSDSSSFWRTNAFNLLVPSSIVSVSELSESSESSPVFLSLLLLSSESDGFWNNFLLGVAAVASTEFWVRATLMFRVIAGEVCKALFWITFSPELALRCLVFCPLRGLAAGFLGEESF
jgi:hypothetical protein